MSNFLLSVGEYFYIERAIDRFKNSFYCIVMDLKVLFGKKLKSLREERGLTQQELAELVNMQPNSIAQIEIGYKAVSFATIEKFAEKLDISYSELFDFQELQTPSSLISSILHELNNFQVNELKYILSSLRRFSKFLKKQ